VCGVSQAIGVSDNVMVTADLNVNFTCAVTAPKAVEAEGGCRLEGHASGPVEELLALVDEHDLVIPQTYGRPSEAVKVDT
jgi:acyl-coenzyme A thioesterase PaaI-like protein